MARKPTPPAKKSPKAKASTKPAAKAVKKTAVKATKKAAKPPVKKAAKTALKTTRPAAKKAPKKTVKGAIPAMAVETDEDEWVLRLFVAGQSPKSVLAYANLKKICQQHLPGKHRIELVDLTKEPHLAQAYQIVAIPTLVRQLPEPIKRVIGDLSDHERALIGMDLRSR